MNLIVFDLEWNIGYQPKTFLYHGAEITLRGEIIQIGAVRIDERGDVLDTFDMTLKPRIFRKLQHHIAKVTGLTQLDLDGGVPIADGLAEFVRWAGPDAAFAEWGLDDVPVLKQNLYLCGLDERWPARWYDLQRIFLQSYPRREGEGMTLESVVDRMGIEKDIPFHNALDDALYTVRIARLLPLADALRAYPSPDAQLREALLTDPSADYYDVQIFPDRLDHDDYKNDPALCGVDCPGRGRDLAQAGQHRLLYPGRLPGARAVVSAVQAVPPRRPALEFRPLHRGRPPRRPGKVPPPESPPGGPLKKAQPGGGGSPPDLKQGAPSVRRRGAPP